MTVSNIPVSAIDVPAGRRKLDPAWVKTLAELMGTPDRCAPIEVIAQGERFRLVFGGHRLAAFQIKHWDHIPATVRTEAEFASAAEVTLSEIIENFGRRDLSALDRAVDIARWREVYEAVHGAVRKGRPQKLSQVATISDEAIDRFTASFSDAARKVLGLNRDAISRAMRIASVPATLRDQIALHSVADNQSELLLLASEPASRQAQIVELMTRIALPAASVSDAIAIIDRKPERQRDAAWQKLAANFSRLKEAEQARFFELHEGAIQRWMANRRPS